MPRTAHLEPLLFIALWFFTRLITGKNLVDSSWDKLCFLNVKNFNCIFVGCRGCKIKERKKNLVMGMYV
jgi:hypothetical protein